jgi:hypothetical protein
MRTHFLDKPLHVIQNTVNWLIESNILLIANKEFYKKKVLFSHFLKSKLKPSLHGFIKSKSTVTNLVIFLDIDLFTKSN